jgi:hypothetical protein
MATEIRQIVFKQTEVCAAINDYRRRRNEPLPVGTIDGIAFSEGPDVTATLTIKNNAGDNIAVTLSREAVAAALILFCINRKIPLPAKGQKKLQKIGDSVGLTIKQEVRVRQVLA